MEEAAAREVWCGTGEARARGLGSLEGGGW